MPAAGGPRSSFMLGASRVSARSTGFSHRVGAPTLTGLRPFALPHPDKPCNYQQRGVLPASTRDSGVELTQLFNHYFEEEKNDGAKDHHDHRRARPSAKICLASNPLIRYSARNLRATARPASAR